MMSTLTGMDVPEKLLALVSRYALQSDAVWAMRSIPRLGVLSFWPPTRPREAC
jgi:hypothetical protein